MARIKPLGLSDNQIEALLGSELDDWIHDPFSNGETFPESTAPKAWASLLLDRTRDDIAEEASVDLQDVPWPLIAHALVVREEGSLTREGLAPLCAKALKQGAWPADANEIRAWFTVTAEHEGFKPADSSTLEAVIDEVLAEKANFIAERGMGAMGPLMGVILGKLGKGADGKAVSAILRERLS